MYAHNTHEHTELLPDYCWKGLNSKVLPTAHSYPMENTFNHLFFALFILQALFVPI